MKNMYQVLYWLTGWFIIDWSFRLIFILPFQLLKGLIPNDETIKRWNRQSEENEVNQTAMQQLYEDD